ncbi:aldolase/citrate lyase family protein [Kordiimonas aquimaris]|uniref:aldolase/citrate lyase family protein n=1 Tax=Kordiimonas aquimaris TaxID=707591 RepID=UPI0021D099B6|nr:aldolase/citrate lyase family protein [Kordiimonas aquimaris]
MKVRHLPLAALTYAICFFMPLTLNADDFPFADIAGGGQEEMPNPTQEATVRPGLIDLWKSGKPAFGEYTTPRHREEVESSQEPPLFTVQMGRDLAANPLLDYVFLNLEQYYNADSVRGALEGLRYDGADSVKTLLVRIPPIYQDGVDISRARAKEALDLGADGVVLPHIRSAEEARVAVSFFDDYNVWSPKNPDGKIVVMLLVEDPNVFAELEEIANIPGYSSLACGIGSLTQALGGDREAAEVLNQQVLAHSKRAGMVDLITATEETMALRVKQGFLGLLPIGPNKDAAIRVGRAAADS